jgi:hypothetical protein
MLVKGSMPLLVQRLVQNASLLLLWGTGEPFRVFE